MHYWSALQNKSCEVKFMLCNFKSQEKFVLNIQYRGILHVECFLITIIMQD